MFLGAFAKLRKASLNKHPAVGRSVCQVTGHRGQGFIPQCVTVGRRGGNCFKWPKIWAVFPTGQFSGTYATLTQ